ncbi:hypothetical protein BP5796_04234 [Coleophoma crateriformis]|uniref:Uncharacterized protein n=1 Tax=Coleophoma crateriformis TaxID=565419 RepID=A0A3D8SHU2_9HELO|nr:hypothetical protein BP5796_04234 [Coleophoma crateriformis]
MAASKKIIALVTGANTGIGLSVATKLAKDHGYHVIIGSRNEAAGKEVATALVADGFAASSIQLDLCSDESITAAVSSIEKEFGALDVLVNNAGISMENIDEYKHLSTRELFKQIFDTNVFGTACLTDACLPLIRRSAFARLVFVSSRMGSLTEMLNKDTPWYNFEFKIYDASKAAVHVLALNYVRILDGTGALVNVVSPGLVSTKLTGFTPYGAPTDVGARRIVELATLEKGGPTGTFSDNDGNIPW